jgi:hypothetical protein
MALVLYTITQLGFPRLLALAIDWTMFDTTLPSGERMRYQVLRIAGAWLVRADEAVTTSCHPGLPRVGAYGEGSAARGVPRQLPPTARSGCGGPRVGPDKMRLFVEATPGARTRQPSLPPKSGRGPRTRNVDHRRVETRRRTPLSGRSSSNHAMTTSCTLDGFSCHRGSGYMPGNSWRGLGRGLRATSAPASGRGPSGLRPFSTPRLHTHRGADAPFLLPAAVSHRRVRVRGFLHSVGVAPSPTACSRIDRGSSSRARQGNREGPGRGSRRVVWPPGASPAVRAAPGPTSYRYNPRR